MDTPIPPIPSAPQPTAMPVPSNIPPSPKVIQRLQELYEHMRVAASQAYSSYY